MPPPTPDTWLTSRQTTRPRIKPTKGQLFLVLVLVGGALTGIYRWVQHDAEAHRVAIAQQTQATNARLAQQDAAQRAHAARLAANPPSAQRDTAADVAELCNALRSAGASTCTLRGGLLSDPYLDVTYPGSGTEARAFCLAAASHTRQAAPLFPGRRFQMQVFSPNGDGSRPLSVCNL